MRSMLIALATAVSMALLACGVAVAETVTSDFEAPVFHTGSVNGQDGWKSAVPGNIPSLDWGMTRQLSPILALRLHSAANPCAFQMRTTQTRIRFRPSTNFRRIPSRQCLRARVWPTRVHRPVLVHFHHAQRCAAWAPHGRQPRQWRGRTDVLHWPGRYGGRHPLSPSMTSPNQMAPSSRYFLGRLTRDVPHTIRFWIKLNPGPDNDVVGIFIDGSSAGKCFTTWENSYPQPVPISDRLLFRSNGKKVTSQSLVGGGYLFDNVTTTTANGPGPGLVAPPVDIDKTTETRSALPGQLITYRISVRNRGDAPVRGLRACDRAPRALTFVGPRCVCTGLRAVGCASRPVCCGPVSARRSAPPSGCARTSRRRPSPTPRAWTSPPGPRRYDTVPARHAAVIPEQRRRRVARDAATIGVERTRSLPGGAESARPRSLLR